MSLVDYVKKSLQVYERILFSIPLHDKIEEAILKTVRTLTNGESLLVCGNGGSASDAQHITGELVGRFLKERKALNVICLSDNPTVLTALGNDYGYDSIFSRQVEAYGKKEGILLGLSTSGNSPNVISAFESAKKIGMLTIAFTGESGGKLEPIADILINIPSLLTPLIQQGHLLLYHYFCDQIEKRITTQRAE